MKFFALRISRVVALCAMPVSPSVRVRCSVLRSGLGAGRTELMKLIAGIDKRSAVTCLLMAAVRNHNVGAAIRHWLVPEDRKKEGIIKERAVKMNMALPSMRNLTIAGMIGKVKQPGCA